MTKISKIALIPARSGSKGILNKNLQKIGGMTLVEWAINVAIESNCFDEICLSTDSTEIREIGLRKNVSVPFLRPDNLSGDSVRQKEVIDHCLSYYRGKGTSFDIVTLLQPTSPFRLPDDLKAAHMEFEKSKYQTMVSVMEITEFDDSSSYYENLDIAKSSSSFKNLIPILEATGENSSGTLRQEFRKKFWRNGAIYIFRSKNLSANNRLILPPVLGYKMPWQRSVNIDNEEDLELAKLIHNTKLNFNLF
jgi:CMP-N,N'-diacetyllegionaminic acid synthase